MGIVNTDRHGKPYITTPPRPMDWSDILNLDDRLKELRKLTRTLNRYINIDCDSPHLVKPIHAELSLQVNLLSEQIKDARYEAYKTDGDPF